MATYVRIPDKIDAIKFTGGVNGALTVKTWAQAHGFDIHWDLQNGRKVLTVVREGFEPVSVEVNDYICLDGKGLLYTMLPSYFERSYLQDNGDCSNPECPYCETRAIALPSPVSAIDVVERG